MYAAAGTFVQVIGRDCCSSSAELGAALENSTFAMLPSMSEADALMVIFVWRCEDVAVARAEQGNRRGVLRAKPEAADGLSGNHSAVAPVRPTKAVCSADGHRRGHRVTGVVNLARDQIDEMFGEDRAVYFKVTERELPLPKIEREIEV